MLSLWPLTFGAACITTHRALQGYTGSLATKTMRIAPKQEITRGISQSYSLFDQDCVVAAGLQELLMGMGDGGNNISKNLGV